MHEKFDRRCIACRNINKQYDMIRIAKLGDQFIIDSQHKLGGRGAYICNNIQCLEKTICKRILNRAYKSNVGDSIYQELKKYEQNN